MEDTSQLIAQFVDRLSELSKGERACLRRCAGKVLKEADGQAVLTFYRCLPYNVPVWQESRWFAAGCLACLWDDAGTMPIEGCFARMRKESDTIEGRISALLDMQWDEEGFLLSKIARLLKMARQKGFDIDCGILLNDLIYWNSENQFVQRKWAKAIYYANLEQ